jgi:hypothetical protein
MRILLAWTAAVCGIVSCGGNCSGSERILLCIKVGSIVYS